MHTRLFPKQDSFISNSPNYVLSNFGRDELVDVAAMNTYSTVYTQSYQTASIVSNVAAMCVHSYYGSITGSINGSVFELIGVYESGSISASYTGSMESFTGSAFNFNGTISGNVNGKYGILNNSYVKNMIPIINRSILQFDLTPISSALANGDISVIPEFKLNLRVTDAISLPLEYSIYCYPLAKSWTNGTGILSDNGSNVGVNWAYTNYPDLGSVWYSPMNLSYVPTDDYLNNPSTSSFIRGGGVWYYALTTSSMDLQSGSSLMCTQSFGYFQNSDISIDITNICKGWMGGGIHNNGLILMTSQETNKSGSTNGELKFFAKETNTIYTPYIDVMWDDSTYLSGSDLISSSLAPVTSSVGVSVTVTNIKKNYKAGSINRFDVFARDAHPQKNFNRLQTVYLEPKYLPTSSYYSIKDNESEEVIIDFDEFTKLSLDSNGNFFILDTTGFPQERFYRVLIKCELDDGTVEIYDNNTTFKISR